MKCLYPVFSFIGAGAVAYAYIYLLLRFPLIAGMIILLLGFYGFLVAWYQFSKTKDIPKPWRYILPK